MSGGSEPFNSMRLDFAAADANALFNSPLQPPPASQNYQPSAAVTAAPININGTVAAGESAAMTPGHLVGSDSEPVKKKRGRPRKYTPDGNVALGLAPTSSPLATAVNHGQNNDQNQNQSSGGAGAFAPGVASASQSSMKKRGRPRGSLNKNHRSSETVLTPQFIVVKAGEDLSSKIMSLCMGDSSSISILSANGTIANVTLSSIGAPGGSVTYEGRFEILNLHGTLLRTGTGQYNKAGSLTLMLSGPDGRVLGGAILGVCVAASPVQLVVMSYDFVGRKKSKSANQMENISAPPKVSLSFQTSSPSRGTLSESSGGTGSPLNQSTEVGNNNNTPQGGISGMPWK